MGKFEFIQNGDASSDNNSGGHGRRVNNDAIPELIDFKRVFSILSRHKWLILFSVIIFVSAGYYISNYYLLPIYRSQATILITNSETTLPGGEGGVGKVISQSFNPAMEGGNIQNAIHLFQSRELSNKVAQQIKDLENQPNGKLYPVLWEKYPDDISIASDETISGRIKRGLNLAPEEQGSNLLQLTYESYSPYEAARIINIALNEFQDLSLEKKRASAQNALVFLREEKKKIQDQLNQAEKQLSTYMNEKDVVSLDSQASSRVSSLSQLETERQSLQIQFESVRTEINRLEKQIESIRPGLADQYSQAIGPTINNYQQRLAELKTQRFVLLSNNPQLKENPNSEPELRKLNSQIKELEEEIQSLSQSLLSSDDDTGLSFNSNGDIAQEFSNIKNKLTELKIQKNQLQAQIDLLDQRIEDSQRFLNEVPENRIQLARLQRKVDMYEQLYQTISQQETEMALWKQSQSSIGSIVDFARVSNSPVKPQKMLWLAISAMLGFCFPVGILLVVDYFTSVIKSTEQLKKFDFPLLAVIYDHTLVGNKKWSLLSTSSNNGSSPISKEVVLHHNTASPVAESYRRLTGNLMYSNPDNVPQTIMITSGGQGEGKSTLTANLAAALAEIDKKVLVIDCDFRRPAIHKKFGLNRTPGINEVTFDESHLSEAIKPTEISNLYLLPTGKSPVSPAKLTASFKFNEMLDVLKSNYDVILFDTSPYGIVSDIAPLIGLSDVLLVTVKFGETKEKILKHTLEDLNISKVNNLGLVLNKYRPDKSYDHYETKELHNYMYREYYEYEEQKEAQ